ncbi:MAG TPA: acyl-CoA dehydrogenase family protein [Pseudomonadales bacterium]|nr:acyl-CoA dehydrogenase family protein [Pseudomonadales bacterium]
MNFELTNDQKNLQNTVREWAQSELAPRAYELDKAAEFPTELYLKMNKDIGVCAIPFKEEHGGLGLGVLDMSIAIEELARADQTFALSVMVAVATGLTLQTFGSAYQKEKYLPDIVAGRAIGSIAGTEPQAGSWTAGFKTRAVRQNDKWSLTGEKAFITNSGADITSYNLVCAITSAPDAEKTSMTLFLVPAGTPGVTIGKSYDKLGWRSSDTHPIYLDGALVGDEAIVGKEGDGRYIVHKTYQSARCFLSACALGLSQACLDHSIAYAKDREAFGRKLGGLQLIQQMIADMAVKVETSRLLARQAAVKADAGTASILELAMAKYYCCEMSSQVADLALQVHGGFGFMNDCPISRYLRDTRITRIGDGSSQIQSMIIAKELGLDVTFT